MKAKTLILSSIVPTQFIGLRTNASVGLEIDPATYAFKGDSLHIKFTPDQSPQWRWGLGTYSMEVPDLMVDINEENRDENWDVEIKRAYGLFTEYYFNSSQSGWFVGGQISQQKVQIEKIGVQSTEFTNNLFMMNLGYKWKIKNSSFYMLPWAGIGYTKTVDNKHARVESGFDVNPVVAFMTVHLGYEF